MGSVVRRDERVGSTAGSAFAGELDSMESSTGSTVLVGDFVPSSKNANSGSSADVSFLSFSVGFVVLNARLDMNFGVTSAFDAAHCFVPLIGNFEVREAALWHALQTYRDDTARERNILNYVEIVK